MPGIVSSVVLFVIGAITRFAFSDEVIRWTASGENHAIHVDTIGMILMIAAGVLFVISLVWNFMAVAPVDEVEYDEMTVKKPYEEPEKVVRRRSSKKDKL